MEQPESSFSRYKISEVLKNGKFHEGHSDGVGDCREVDPL